MKKEFVTYPLALRMKQRGFDEPCLKSYTKDGDFVTKMWQEVECDAPLFQQAFRWFREKYNIDAWVQPFMREKNGTPFLPDESYGYWIFKDGAFITDEVDFLNPEEAELSCLEKLIEIIEQSKSE